MNTATHDARTWPKWDLDLRHDDGHTSTIQRFAPDAESLIVWFQNACRYSGWDLTVTGYRVAAETAGEMTADVSLPGRAVCAWCKADLGPREGLEEGQISHGACGACAARVLEGTAT